MLVGGSGSVALGDLGSTSVVSNGTSTSDDWNYSEVIIDSINLVLYTALCFVSAWRFLVHFLYAKPPPGLAPGPVPSLMASSGILPAPSSLFPATPATTGIAPVTSTVLYTSSQAYTSNYTTSPAYASPLFGSPAPAGGVWAPRWNQPESSCCRCKCCKRRGWGKKNKNMCRAWYSRLVQFHAFLFSFYFCTVLYAVVSMVLDFEVEPYGTGEQGFLTGLNFFFGTIASCLFFTSLLLILVHMLEQMYSSIVNRRLWVSILANILFWTILCLPYLYTICCSVYFMAHPEKCGPPTYESSEEDIHWLYNTSVVAISVYSIISAIGYTVTVFLVLRKVYYLEKTDVFFRFRQTSLYLLLLVMVVCLVSFLLQGIMLLYRPITGQVINPYVFQVFAYWIPQILSSILLLWVARKPEGYGKYATLIQMPS